MYFFSWRHRPEGGQRLLNVEASRSHWHTTIGLTSLNEWLDQRRDLYRTIHNTHKTDFRASGRTGTRNSSKWATADTYLKIARPPGSAHSLILCSLKYSTVDFRARDSAVGIVTHYGLDSPRIESRWGRDFPHPLGPTLGPTQPPIQWVAGLFPAGKATEACRWPPIPI
jgi:hypothetical protein